MARRVPPLLFPVIGLVILVVLSTLLAEPPKRAEPFANRSVFNTGPSGYRAFYLAGKKAGVSVTSWEKSFDDLDKLPRPATMLIVTPYTVGTRILFGRQEVSHLLTWVHQGNTAVLLDDFVRHGSESLAKRLKLTVQAGMDRPVRMKVSGREGLLNTYVQQALITRSNRRFVWEEDFPARALLTDDADRAAMIRVPYGKGTLILGTTADMAENNYLHKPANDNHQFLANLLTLEHKPVFINEFVHGYNEINDIFAYYRERTPLGLVLMQGIFGFLLLLWLSFVRWQPQGQTAAAAEETESGMRLFVDSMAGIGERNRVASLALGPQLHLIEQTLRRRHQMGLDSAGDDARLQHLLADVGDRYSGKDMTAAALTEGLKKARQAVELEARLERGDVLKLSRQLTVIQETLQHGKR